MLFIDEAKKLAKERMVKAVDMFHNDINGVHVGKANSSLLNGVVVETDSGRMKVNQIATISIVDNKTLSIKPWDVTVVPAVRKALEAGVGTVIVEGAVVRLVLPDLTQETRKKYAKSLDDSAENARVAVRNIRRDVIDKYKRMQQKKEMSEDDLHTISDDVQKVTDDMIKNIDKALRDKKDEILNF